MKTNRQQFSLRTLLIFMAIAAMMIAFVANCPRVAGVIALGLLWLAVESGLIGVVLAAVPSRTTYGGHSILGVIVGTIFAALSFMLAALFVWMTTQVDGGIVGQVGIMIPGMFFLLYGCACLRMIWLCLNGVDDGGER